MICDCVEQSHRLYLCCFHMQIGVDLAEWPHQVTRSIVIDGIEVIATGLKSFGILVPDWLLRMSMICGVLEGLKQPPMTCHVGKVLHSFTFGHSVFNIRHLSVCEFIGILPGLKWNVPFSLLEAVGELLFTSVGPHLYLLGDRFQLFHHSLVFGKEMDHIVVRFPEGRSSNLNSFITAVDLSRLQLPLTTKKQRKTSRSLQKLNVWPSKHFWCSMPF